MSFENGYLNIVMLHIYKSFITLSMVDISYFELLDYMFSNIRSRSILLEIYFIIKKPTISIEKNMPNTY